MPTFDYRAAFTAALRAGDEIVARGVVTQASLAGMDPYKIYFEIFAPSMVEIGEMWERNELTVAEEHMATSITERLIGELSPWFNSMAQPNSTIILGCVQGERHTLGLRMLSDLFRQQGWRTLYLGADVPTEDWVRLLARTQAHAVAISVNIQRHTLQVRSLITELRKVQPQVYVLVGGAVFNRNPDLWHTIGADYYHAEPLKAVQHITAHRQANETQR
jgi:methanogenic corrinoid protein MtbC1